MTRWFEHEDELKPGEKGAEPILGKKFSPFWFFGMLVLFGLIVMFLYISLQFVFSAAHAH
jgi:hypothetical protein